MVTFAIDLRGEMFIMEADKAPIEIIGKESKGAIISHEKITELLLQDFDISSDAFWCFSKLVLEKGKMYTGDITLEGDFESGEYELELINVSLIKDSFNNISNSTISI